MRGMSSRRLGALCLAVLALVIPGCGQERSFSAEEFVEEVNAQGVELTLEEELLTEEEGKELFAVELEPVAELPGEAGKGEDRHSAGSLSVYEDEGRADGEMETCRAAADLICYQAGNIVIVLEGAGIEAQQLAKAMERLAEE